MLLASDETGWTCTPGRGAGCAVFVMVGMGVALDGRVAEVSGAFDAFATAVDVGAAVDGGATGG